MSNLVSQGGVDPTPTMPGAASRHAELSMMLPRVLLGAVLATKLLASPPDDLVIAAMSLAEVPNYSWRKVVTDDARTYEIEGKTERDGLTWQRQPMPKTIAKRLGRAADVDLEAFFCGSAEFVIRTDMGWKFLSELPKIHPQWIDTDGPSYLPVPLRMPSWENEDSASIGPWEDNPVVFVPIPQAGNDGPRSNYQFALSRPQDELAVIVTSFSNLLIEDSIATGTISDLGSQLLLVHAGHDYITPVVAKGAFKLWLRDKRVMKYTLELAGIVIVEKRPSLIRQISSTVVTKIGTTKVAPPSEVRRKLH
jgi:hypothetical protein